MKNLRFGIGLLLLSLLFFGCSSDESTDPAIDETKLFGTYHVSYFEEFDSLSFWASYRTDGVSSDRIKLNSSSKLTMDENVLNEDELIGPVYLLNLDVKKEDLKQEYSIVWKRSDGEIFSNKIFMPGTVSILSPVSGKEHSLNDDLTIKFGTGLNHRGGEVEFEIEGKRWTADGGESRFVRKRPTSENEIVFNKEELKDFMVGDAEIKISRRKSSNQDVRGHDEKGGIIHSVYSGKSVKIKFRY